MDLGIAIAIASFVATVVFGILSYISSCRQDRPPGGVSIRVFQDSSVQTITRVDARPSVPADPQDMLLAYGGAMLASTVVYWLWRPYLLAAVGAILVATIIATWATRSWTLSTNAGRGRSILAVVAFGLIGADLFLLVFPGLPWGSGLRLNWTFWQGAHLYGPGFVGGSLSVLLATAASLLPLVAGPLAVAFRRSGDRSQNLKRATTWYSVRDRLAGFGLRQSVLWTAAGLAVFGLGLAFGLPHFHPGSVPTHFAVSTK